MSLGVKKVRGKASIEQPWLSLYPVGLRTARQHLAELQGQFTLIEYLGMCNRRHHMPVVEFYGQKYSFNDLLGEAATVGAALASLGVKEGDSLCAFLRSVPEYLMILFACEQIGATLICRDGTRKENLESLQYANAKILFAHDFIPADEADYYYANSDLEHIITISSCYYGNEADMPDYILNSLKKMYDAGVSRDERNIDWVNLMMRGNTYFAPWKAERDPNRPLCNPYTSGSTGPSKEIIHAASSMIGYISQINFPNAETGKSVLLTLFPPTLIAILNSVLLYNIAQMNVLILSPYCEPEDISREMLRYRPWMMMTVPMMAELLMYSKYIPEDYDMSYLKVLAGGADPVNNKWMDRLFAWMRKHNCRATFSQAYGLSECGSAVAMPMGKSFYDCFSGIPMPLTNIGIFNPETNEELNYGEVGEVCIQTPGHMLGYGGAAKASTEEVLQVHEDGRMFVHSGDFGYITREGCLYVLSRGLRRRYGFEPGYLFDLPIENKACKVKGIFDCYAVSVKDHEHPGYYKPYMFVQPEEGYTIEMLEPEIRACLSEEEQPVKIFKSEGREYFHFKLNRRILSAQIYESEQRDA